MTHFSKKQDTIQKDVKCEEYWQQQQKSEQQQVDLSHNNENSFMINQFARIKSPYAAEYFDKQIKYNRQSIIKKYQQNFYIHNVVYLKEIQFSFSLSTSLKFKSTSLEIQIHQVQLSFFLVSISVYNTQGHQSIFGFQFDKEIDSGRYGSVYAARNPFAENSMVAIKQIYFQKSERQKSIKNGIIQYAILKLFSSLEIGPKSKNIFGFDIIVKKNSILFSMEKGQPISDYISVQVQQEAVQKHFDLLSESLSIAHSLNICLNDIKPSNILYSYDFGKLVFLDFGLTDVKMHQQGSMKLETAKGTYQFCSQQMKQLFFSQRKDFIDTYYNDLVCFQKSRGIIISQFKVRKQSSIEDYYATAYKKEQSQAYVQDENQCAQQIVLIRLTYLIFEKNIEGILRILSNQSISKQKIRAKGCFLRDVVNKISDKYFAKQIQKTLRTIFSGISQGYYQDEEFNHFNEDLSNFKISKKNKDIAHLDKKKVLKLTKRKLVETKFMIQFQQESNLQSLCEYSLLLEDQLKTRPFYKGLSNIAQNLSFLKFRQEMINLMYLIDVQFSPASLEYSDNQFLFNCIETIFSLAVVKSLSFQKTIFLQVAYKDQKTLVLSNMKKIQNWAHLNYQKATKIIISYLVDQVQNFQNSINTIANIFRHMTRHLILRRIIHHVKIFVSQCSVLIQRIITLLDSLVQVCSQDSYKILESILKKIFLIRYEICDAMFFLLYDAINIDEKIYFFMDASMEHIKHKGSENGSYGYEVIRKSLQRIDLLKQIKSYSFLMIFLDTVPFFAMKKVKALEKVTSFYNRIVSKKGQFNQQRLVEFEYTLLAKIFSIMLFQNRFYQMYELYESVRFKQRYTRIKSSQKLMYQFLVKINCSFKIKLFKKSLNITLQTFNGFQQKLLSEERGYLLRNTEFAEELIIPGKTYDNKNKLSRKQLIFLDKNIKYEWRFINEDLALRNSLGQKLTLANNLILYYSRKKIPVESYIKAYFNSLDQYRKELNDRFATLNIIFLKQISLCRLLGLEIQWQAQKNQSQLIYFQKYLSIIVTIFKNLKQYSKTQIENQYKLFERLLQQMKGCQQPFFAIKILQIRSRYAAFLCMYDCSKAKQLQYLKSIQTYIRSYDVQTLSPEYYFCCLMAVSEKQLVLKSFSKENIQQLIMQYLKFDLQHKNFILYYCFEATQMKFLVCALQTSIKYQFQRNIQFCQEQENIQQELAHFRNATHTQKQISIFLLLTKKNCNFTQDNYPNNLYIQFIGQLVTVICICVQKNLQNLLKGQQYQFLNNRRGKIGLRFIKNLIHQCNSTEQQNQGYFLLLILKLKKIMFHFYPQQKDEKEFRIDSISKLKKIDSAQIPFLVNQRLMINVLDFYLLYFKDQQLGCSNSTYTQSKDKLSKMMIKKFRNNRQIINSQSTKEKTILLRFVQKNKNCQEYAHSNANEEKQIWSLIKISHENKQRSMQQCLLFRKMKRYRLMSM